MDATIFNATFWLSFCGVSAGVIGLVFTAINKSKCSTIKCCCGLTECVRDTAAEEDIELSRIEHNIPESPIIKVQY
tara:strand:- start:110 stop:337 length:228 start_codon:yes stop_codon:yes gene_type:complete